MSDLHGTLRVDPQGVASVGDTYATQAEVYQAYQQRLQAIRERYTAAWGTDETGAKFTERFTDGVDTIDGLVGGTRQRLDYAAMALRAAGKNYEEADDSARDLSNHVALAMEQPSGYSGALGGERLSPASGSGAGAGLAGAAPLGAGAAPSGAVASPMSEHAPEAARADVAGFVPGAGGAPLAGASPAALVAHAPRADTPGFVPADQYSGALGGMPLSPAASQGAALAPAVSSPLGASSPLAADVSVAAPVPVPLQPRLEALPPAPDGGTVVDAGRYVSATPAVGPDGQPADDRGWRFFLVEDNPSVEPNAPGYRPLHVNYPPTDV